MTDPVLTSRLVLAPIGMEDIELLTVLYGDPVVAHWTGPWTPSGIAAWTEAMADRWRCDGVGKWLALDRCDGALVGRGGFTRIELGGETVLELGWVVRDEVAGRGFATELGRAALRWADVFHPSVPIVAFTELHNRASRGVMERIGMRRAGSVQREGLVEGKAGLHPDAPFALYRLLPGGDDAGASLHRARGPVELPG